MNAAFGAAKTGTTFDLVSYVIRPQVILRYVCWICSVVVFGCISAKGWHKGKCLYNNDNSACSFGSLLGLVGFVASIAFLILEALFHNISSIKMRRRAVLLDLGFSGLWSFMYLICFFYLAIAWGKSQYPPLGYGINSLRAAIVFSLLSIGAWAGCAYFAHLKWQQGFDMSQFATGYENEDIVTGAGYSAYTGGVEASQPAFQDAPFTSGMDNMSGQDINYQAPAY